MKQRKKTGGVRSILVVCLVGLVLLAGCQDRGGGSSPGGESNSTSSTVEGREADGERLLREFILPYEALAGGALFETPQEIAPDALTAFCLYAARTQLGEERFLVKSEHYQAMLLPEEYLQGYAQILFGAPVPADLGDTELVYCDSEFTTEGKIAVPEELEGYTGRVYGSSYVQEGMVPDYEIALLEAKDTGSGLDVRVSRTADGIPLPEVTYSFVFVPEVEDPLLGEQFPEGAYRLTAVRADIGPEFTQIREPQQLVQLSKLVNSGDKTYLGSTFVLENDIDLSGVSFEPIGVSRRFSYKGINLFNATFDGQGHTISNLTMDHPFQPSSHNGIGLPVGFFGETGSDAVIENLHLEQVSICGDSGVGGLAGSFTGRMYHCSVSGAVSGRSEVGGLVGGSNSKDNRAELVDCHTDVQVTGTGSTGGLAGYAGNAWYEGCSAKGTVTVVAKKQGDIPGVVGGFAGHQHGSVIRNCFASVNVRTQVSSNMVGNFIGLSEYGTTIHSYCNQDAGSAWDLVDDDYGGYIDVTALPQGEYRAKLAQAVPQGYTKDNGIVGTDLNNKLYLVGAVDFSKESLGALIYNPDERTNKYVQDCDSLAVSEGKMILIPIHRDFQVAVYGDYPEGRQQIYHASAEDELYWQTTGYALRLDCDELLEAGVPVVIQLEHDGRKVEYPIAPKPGEMQVVYLDA